MSRLWRSLTPGEQAWARLMIYVVLVLLVTQIAWRGTP